MEVRFVTEEDVFVEEGIVANVLVYEEGTVVHLDTRHFPLPDDYDELVEWEYSSVLLLPTTPVPNIGNFFSVECKLDKAALEWHFKEAF